MPKRVYAEPTPEILLIEAEAKEHGAYLPAWMRGHARSNQKASLLGKGFSYSHSRSGTHFYKRDLEAVKAAALEAITDVLGPRPGNALRAEGYESIQDIANNTPSDLLAIEGVGKGTVDRVYNFIKANESQEVPDSESDCGC